MKSYGNFNNVKHDDGDKILGYERKREILLDVPFDICLLRLKYKDGSFKDVRTYLDKGVIDEIKKCGLEEEFFVKRLFGENGLIIKEGRNDYIYLGGIDKKTGMFTRFNIYEGKKMQEHFNKYISENVFPLLTLKDANNEFDLINNCYYYHTGTEDMNEVFENGLLSNYGNNSREGFASLTSTFFPANYEINNLYDSVKQYGNGTKTKGTHVFILRIPTIYRGKENNNVNLFPPMPTHKLIDYSTGSSIIIPELIYGMYDSVSGILYKNPNYKSKYNPNGLVYDGETAELLRDKFPDWYSFMDSRKTITFNKLYKYDTDNGVFDDICKYYGIKEDYSKIIK